MLFGKKQEKHIEYDSDWLSNLVTTRENQFGDLINELRKEEHKRNKKNEKWREVASKARHLMHVRVREGLEVTSHLINKE